ncbi:MAG: hypothetical protein ACRDGG_02000 [Anaerolineae bacterium]
MTILLDAIDEARRIVGVAAESGLTLRLLGGLAIRIHSPSAAHRSLARSYPDLDFALPDKRGDRVEKLLGDLGYEPNKTFNLLNGDSRLLFYDTANERQVDVFVGGFQMCHRIPITERIMLEPLTLPLAELLLTKLQVVQMNEKDARDLCALLLDHPLGEGDVETFNLPLIAKWCADDWGLWKTAGLSAQKVRDYCDTHDLEPDQKHIIIERLAALAAALDGAPKSLKWKTRAKIGERMRWYELPEEVKRG